MQNGLPGRCLVAGQWERGWMGDPDGREACSEPLQWSGSNGLLSASPRDASSCFACYSLLSPSYGNAHFVKMPEQTLQEKPWM